MYVWTRPKNSTALWSLSCRHWSNSTHSIWCYKGGVVTEMKSPVAKFVSIFVAPCPNTKTWLKKLNRYHIQIPAPKLESWLLYLTYYQHFHHIQRWHDVKSSFVQNTMWFYIYMAEQYDTKSNVKLCGFRSQLKASYMSSHTEELWYTETVCLWMTIYIYIYIYIYKA